MGTCDDAHLNVHVKKQACDDTTNRKDDHVARHNSFGGDCYSFGMRIG